MLELPVPTLDGKLLPPVKYDSIEEALVGVRDDLAKVMKERSSE